MKKLIFSLILITPFLSFGAFKTIDSDASLSRLISTFEINVSDANNIQLDVWNLKGAKKTEMLGSRIEEYQEYVKYSLKNPFENADKSSNLEFYIFRKIKPLILEVKNIANTEFENSDIRVDVTMLVDTKTKKTIKSKITIFYKDLVAAEGSLDTNSKLQIINDLGNNLKNFRIQELKVIKNSLNSGKRSFDLEIKILQSGKVINQNLNVNLLNIKKTPIEKEILEEDSLDEEEVEGSTDETDHTHS